MLADRRNLLLYWTAVFKQIAGSLRNVRTEMSTQSVLNRIMSGSLVLQIAIGIAAGVALSLLSPPAAKASMLLGNLFVSALKAVAPILVLVLVASAIANRRASHTAQLRPIVIMMS